MAPVAEIFSCVRETGNEGLPGVVASPEQHDKAAREDSVRGVKGLGSVDDSSAIVVQICALPADELHYWLQGFWGSDNFAYLFRVFVQLQELAPLDGPNMAVAHDVG